MMVATDANVRTTQAADKQGLSVALRVAFTGGAVMGFTVVGLGLLGVSLFFYLMTLDRDTLTSGLGWTNTGTLIAAVDSLASFGFGASSIALFARVAGGIYTKVNTYIYFHFVQLCLDGISSSYHSFILSRLLMLELTW